MKRRSFTFGLGALLAAPALPGSVAARAIAPSVTTQQLAVAKIMARSHNRLTLDMLERHLRVSAQMAQSIQNRLVQDGIITQPLGGASMAVSPTNTHCIPNEALKPSNILQKADALRKNIEKLTKSADPVENENEILNSSEIDADPA